MDKYNLKDALLFISRGDTHEILIETNQRTRPDVQSNLQELLNLYPDIIPKVVSLSELQEAGQDDENKGPKERIIHLKDLADVSESEKKVLSYFETARKLGASDIHFLISESIFKVRMRIFGELQTVDEDQPALGYSLCATAILSMADVTETSFFPQREQDARLSPQLMRKIGIFGARYSHRPTGDGLIAVMRLIPDDGDKVPTFKQLGFIPEQIRLLNVMLRRPEGKIVLSGPTGSGIGAYTDLNDNWTVGLVAQNIIPRSIDTKVVNGFKETFKVRPQATAGVSWHNDLFTTALDVDLTPASGFTSDSKRQFASVGAEFNAWKWAQLRAGYRQNMASNSGSAFTAGVGISPFDVVHIDVSGLVGTDHDYGAMAQLQFTF